MNSVSFFDILPSSLADDPAILAWAEIQDKRIAGIESKEYLLAPRAHIDKLKEPLLSYLAWENDVDVWNPDWSLEKKRSVVKEAEFTKRKKGTAFAVRKGLEAQGYQARHTKWWEYEGTPGTFRIDVDVTDEGLDDEAFAEIEQTIDANKAGRSHLDAICVCLTNELGLGFAIIPCAAETGAVHPVKSSQVVNEMEVGFGLSLISVESPYL